MAQTTSSQPHEMTLKKVIEEMERGERSLHLMTTQIDHVNNHEDHQEIDEHYSGAFTAFLNSLSLLKSMDIDGGGVDGGRGCYNRRRIGESKVMEVTQLVDGFAWRKYGQKDIINTIYPRNYYRCTHRSDKNCRAVKQVQQISDSPPKYKIIYNGKHTCINTPKTSPIIIDSPEEHSSAIFMNFESNSESKHLQLFPTSAYPNADTLLRQEYYEIKEEGPSVSHSHDSDSVCSHYPSSLSDNQSTTGMPSISVSYQSDEIVASSYGTIDDYVSMWAEYSELVKYSKTCSNPN